MASNFVPQPTNTDGRPACIQFDIGCLRVSMINHDMSYARGSSDWMEVAVWQIGSENGLKRDWVRLRGFHRSDDVVSMPTTDIARFLKAVERESNKRNQSGS